MNGISTDICLNNTAPHLCCFFGVAGKSLEAVCYASPGVGTLNSNFNFSLTAVMN